MQSLSSSPSVTHLKLPGAEGGGSGTAAADVRAGPGPLKPGRIPDRESRAQRGLHKPLPAQEDPATRACACSEKDLPSATAPARGVILRLRAIGGGRGQQGGRCGRKGRCFAARPREGECGARCARRPGVGAGASSARGQPRCRGRPLEARGGQPRRTCQNWGRGGCGACWKDWKGLRAFSLHKKGVADTAVRFSWAGL